MAKSEESLLNPDFSHVYVERKAEAYPLTARILEKLTDSTVVLIDHYKDFFCKKNQSFFHQRKSLKLILAVEHKPQMYEGSPLCDSFGYQHFYYMTNAMNCLYHCEYCYLQGLYPSANIVVFVNTDDFSRTVSLRIQQHDVYLCLSYDTDLLALEGLTGLVRDWIDCSANQSRLTIELRTKSANFHQIACKKPPSNWILAWSLSPCDVSAAYEKGTPSPANRIRAMKEALEAGWRVRLCVDPIIEVPDWRHSYAELSEMVHRELDIRQLEGVSAGVFRVSPDHLRKMRKNHPSSELLSHPFVPDLAGECRTYRLTLKTEMEEYVKNLFV